MFYIKYVIYKMAISTTDVGENDDVSFCMSSQLCGRQGRQTQTPLSTLNTYYQGESNL